MLTYQGCQKDVTNIDNQRAIANWIKSIAAVANRVNSGKFNAVGSVTLTAGTTTTTVVDPRINMFSFIQFDPTTAHALAAVPTTYVAQVDRTDGQMIITHTNNSQTDRTFNYLVIG